MNENEDLEEIARWFEARGFELRLVREGAVRWAHLARLPAGNIVAPKYGRGDSDIGAARRAQQRYAEEQ
jgi:hypothetical protein